MRLWKLTHGQHLEALGFKEACNQKSVYYHQQLDILIICHVDDPWIDIGLGKDYEHLEDQAEIDRVRRTHAANDPLENRPRPA